MGPRALAWVKEHRNAVIAGAVIAVVFFCLGLSARRPAPSISAHQTEQVHRQAEEHHQEQVATSEQQATQASSEKKLDEQKHLHVHKVERISATGDRVITTDSSLDDDVHIEEASQVNVVVAFSSLAQLAGESSSSSDVHRETTVAQTPAPDRPLRVELLGGGGLSGPVYGAGVAWTLGELPLVHCPASVGLQVQAGGSGPVGLVTLAVQL
jgi:hypothetical protein